MKYFVVSDIHSNYDELMMALEEQGYQKDNNEHTLIVIGDIFDRGHKPLEVMNFLKSIKNKILIRGNHEYMLKMAYDMVDLDIHTLDMLKYNGNLTTICILTNMDADLINPYNYDISDEELQNNWHRVRNKLKPIVEWMFSDEWKNYYEVGDYIFVHASVPLQVKDDPLFKWQRGLKVYNVPEQALEVMDDWRTKATDNNWDQASWCMPHKLFKEGAFDKEINNGKTIVCGHRLTSCFYELIDGYTDKEISDMNPIYYGNGIIAIDACTVISHRCNIFTFEN